jgi:hypothetical protein
MSNLHRGARAGRRTRSLWNKSRRAALRPVWPQIAALTVGLLIVLSAVAWVWASVGIPAFLTGVAFGAALASYCAALHWIADLVSGDHRNKYGTLGEESTAEAFRSRRMRANAWRAIDGVAFNRGDVDHVAIRPGLVVAVETKWDNTAWLVRDGHLDEGGDVLAQARRGAAKIRRLLKSTVEVDVQAVVAVWGKGGDALDRDVTFVDGVWVVRGWAVADIDNWLDAFESAHPNAVEVSSCIGVIEAFVRARDAHEAARSVSLSVG